MPMEKKQQKNVLAARVIGLRIRLPDGVTAAGCRGTNYTRDNSWIGVR